MLTAREVTVRYRRSRGAAVSALSWQIAEGSRTALLGPNGAGKSSIMSVLAGSLRPESGSVSIDGDAATASDLARAVSRMPQQMTAVPRLSCAEQVAYGGWLGGLSEAASRQRALPALEAVGLADRRNDRAGSLSGGQLRRLGLAETLVRGTSYCLLDEPTAGLDPQERARFREVLSSIAGVAFVVATHETHDISELFDTVCIMTEGSFVYVGGVADLLQSTSQTTLEDAYISLMKDHAA